MVLKRILAVVLVFSAVMVAAQSNDPGMDQELSVEESYLQQSVELMIIREQSRAENRDMKLVALEYINEAITRGDAGEEVRATLEFLGTEGTVNQTRENGRLINNYPEVRVKAAAYLGDLGTPEAKTSLIRMCRTDNEPMVLTEIIKSLGKIGISDEETVNVITAVVGRYHILNPDNLLALSALDTYTKLAEASGGINNNLAIETIMNIAEGPYIRPVKDRAKKLLSDLRKQRQSQS